MCRIDAREDRQMRTWTFGVAVREDADDVVVSVRDMPSVVTSRDSLEQALELAQDAIACDVGFLVDKSRNVPHPSPVQDGAHAVALPAQLAAKRSVYEARRAVGISKSELARRMGRKEGEVRRILDPAHGTKLDQLAEAAVALGGRLVVAFQH